MDAAESNTTDKVVNTRRVFALPRDRLFRAWTDPDEFAKWWGPVSWTVKRCELDVRPDGTWKTWFDLPDGGERHVGGIYLEVDAPQRLVFTWDAQLSDDEPEVPSIVTLEFHEHADGSELALSHRKLTSGQAVDMDVGWNNTFDSLDIYVAQTGTDAA